MRRLHTKVNLIPVIAKADTLTDDEVLAFKQRVSITLPYHRVPCLGKTLCIPQAASRGADHFFVLLLFMCCHVFFCYRFWRI